MSLVDGHAVQMPERLSITDESSRENSLLLKIMRDSENDPELKIIRIEFSSPCKTGDNYMSIIKKAIVNAKKSDGNVVIKSFILKIQLKDNNIRTTLDIDSVWANEEHMYSVLFPSMKSVTKSNLAIPEYYFSDSDIVILEDLGSTGYKMRNRVKGLDLPETFLVLDRLAQFHASSLALHFKNPDIFNRFRDNYTHIYLNQQYRDKTRGFLKNILNDAIEILRSQPELESYKNSVDFLEVISKDINEIIPVLQKRPKGNTCVLIHGDLWINNILLLEDKNTDMPVDVKFVDFQGSRLGSVAIDLYHFLYTSIKPEIRRSNMNKLLTHYHKCLHNYFNDFTDGEGESFIDDFTIEIFYEEMRHFRIYGLINAIFLLPVVTLDPDMNMYSFGQNEGKSNSKAHARRLVDLIQEYEHRGWMNFNFEY